MWRNPNHPAAESSSSSGPPVESGQRLATFPRGHKNAPEEFRIELSEYEGRPFVSARIWFRGNDGQFYPSKKGCSIRVAELEGMIEVLTDALALLDDGGAARGRAPARSRGDDRQRATPPPRRAAAAVGSGRDPAPWESSDGRGDFDRGRPMLPPVPGPADTDGF